MNELRWAMGGVGITVDKVQVMGAVLELPAVAGAAAATPGGAAAAYDAVVEAARGLGDGLHARLLRASLGVDFRGAGRNLTARRDEFVTAHNEAAATARTKNVLPTTSRAVYAIENEMLAVLVTMLGAPASGAGRATAPSHPSETVAYEVTYRLRGRAGVEAEVVQVVRALRDEVTGIDIPYACSGDDGGPAHVEALEGGIVVDDRSFGRPGFRIARIQYPAPLRAGEQHRFRYDIHYPGEQAKPDTWFLIAVGGALVRLTVRVAFDRSAIPPRVWLANGVSPDSDGGDPESAEPLTVDAGGCVARTFTAPTFDLAYGISWAWPG